MLAALEADCKGYENCVWEVLCIAKSAGFVEVCRIPVGIGRDKGVGSVDVLPSGVSDGKGGWETLGPEKCALFADPGPVL